MINQPRGRAKKKKASFDVTPASGFTMEEIKKPKNPEGGGGGEQEEEGRSKEKREGGCPY
jgi:hypothetical protein